MERWNQDIALSRLKEIRNEINRSKILSESDTRSKIIDYILIQCLGWSERDIVREERCSETGDYIDYKLSTNIPIIIIEAKKISEPLELPSASSHREYKISGVLGKCKNTIAAMIQARDYAVSKGITFCCVTNGHRYIFFRSQNQQGIEWAKHRALVFRDLSDVEKHFDLFCIHLSKAASESGKLQQTLALTKGFDCVDQFKTLDIRHLTLTRKINRNSLFPIIGEIVRRVFQDLASEEAESEVLEHCYVESPRKADKRRPYLDRSARDLEVSKRDAGEFQQRIASALDPEAKAHNEVIILLGSVGVGKSTFIQRYRNVLAENEISEHGIWLYLNFKHYSDTGLGLDAFIYGQIDRALSGEYSHLGLNDWAFLKQAYHLDYEKLKRGALQPLFLQNPEQFELEFGRKIAEWSDSRQEEHFIKILSTAIKRLHKKVWLNMDSSQFAQLRHQEFQEGSEQAFAADTDVMHELKEAQVERQFFLRDPPMRSQPRAQQ